MPLSTPITEIIAADVVSVEVDQPILDAIRILAEGRFHHLPVVDEKRLVGILSTADILKLNSEALNGADPANHTVLAGRTRVGDIMVAEVIPLSTRATVADAAQLLSSGEYHAIPIMAATGELVGIVTTTDLITHMLGTPERETSQQTESSVNRMQLLENIYEAAKDYLDSGRSDIATEALERAVHEARWAA